jgi:hypothetical protein
VDLGLDQLGKLGIGVDLIEKVRSHGKHQLDGCGNLNDFVVRNLIVITGNYNAIGDILPDLDMAIARRNSA